MRLHPDKPGSTTAAEPRPGERSGGNALTTGQVQARRAALEAQKRYMDDRFGRDRAIGRKRPA
jgi:hypothetical protein